MHLIDHITTVESRNQTYSLKICYPTSKQVNNRSCTRLQTQEQENGRSKNKFLMPSVTGFYLVS